MSSIQTGRTPGRCVTPLRCAFGLNADLGDFGLVIRSAIHTGEIEFRDDDIGGIGVHSGLRMHSCTAVLGDFGSSMERGGGAAIRSTVGTGQALLEYP